MSNQEIHIRTHTGVDGILHLDIPVGIINQNLDVTVSYSTLEEDISEENNLDENNTVDTELAEILATAKPSTDLSELYGVLELTEDPLEYQRRIRDEW